MGIAFETALASLGATRCHDDPVRAALAQRIIALAKAGERNPERLCEAALKAVRSPDPLAGSPPPEGAQPPEADRRSVALNERPQRAQQDQAHNADYDCQRH